MMFDYLNFDEKGVKVVSEIGGVNADMLMDITVYRIKKGAAVGWQLAGKEIAVLLTEGKVKYLFEGREETASRKNVFEAPAGAKSTTDILFT